MSGLRKVNKEDAEGLKGLKGNVPGKRCSKETKKTACLRNATLNENKANLLKVVSKGEYREIRSRDHLQHLVTEYTPMCFYQFKIILLK